MCAARVTLKIYFSFLVLARDASFVFFFVLMMFRCKTPIALFKKTGFEVIQCHGRFRVSMQASDQIDRVAVTR